MPQLQNAGLAICAGLGLVLSSGCRHATPGIRERPPLEAGAAEVDITPPAGSRMAGYFDERLATGTHDPLKAKALLLRQGREEVALVFCDLVGVPLVVSTNARARAAKLTGIPEERIIIAGTHSHTGPLFASTLYTCFHQMAIARDGVDTREKVDYPVFLAERVVEAILQARAGLAPAEVRSAITEVEGVNFNRRHWMKNGTVVFNPGILNSNIVRPAGPVDPSLQALFLSRPGEPSPFASLTVFAMHLDTMGGTRYSADYAYFLEQRLRAAFPRARLSGAETAPFISAFGAGACGDLNHINVARRLDVTGPALTQRIGNTLADSLLQAIPARLAQPTLGFATRTITAPVQRYTPAELAEARTNITRTADPKVPFMSKVIAVKTMDLEHLGPQWPLPVEVIRLDQDTAIVCLPGEIFVELGLAIKNASPFKNTIVLTICNDRPSYIPTLRAFREGSYEVTNARLAPGAGERLVETALALLGEIKP